jgi:hypothetical protein
MLLASFQPSNPLPWRSHSGTLPKLRNAPRNGDNLVQPDHVALKIRAYVDLILQRRACCSVFINLLLSTVVRWQLPIVSLCRRKVQFWLMLTLLFSQIFRRWELALLSATTPGCAWLLAASPFLDLHRLNLQKSGLFIFNMQFSLARGLGYLHYRHSLPRPTRMNSSIFDKPRWGIFLFSDRFAMWTELWTSRHVLARSCEHVVNSSVIYSAPDSIWGTLY